MFASVGVWRAIPKASHVTDQRITRRKFGAMVDVDPLERGAFASVQ